MFSAVCRWKRYGTQTERADFKRKLVDLMEEKKYLKTGEAAKLIGCSCQTLRNCQKRGTLIPEIIFETGHRRYSAEQVRRFAQGRNRGTVKKNL